MTTDTLAVHPVARINGIALNAPDEELSAEVLRQRACTELLRLAAQSAGLLAVDDAAPCDGVISEAASDAIDALLAQNVNPPEPSADECLRHYTAHKNAYRTGERVRVRHILFAVTPGVDVVALRKRAEPIYLEVRCHDGKASAAFGAAARQWSNCPSGEIGGELGWLTCADCAPEFARELFGHIEVGVLARLVHSRFGLHVVEVQEREFGVVQPFTAVQGAVAMALRQQTFVTALRQYLRLLAGGAAVEGVELDSCDTPLVQ